MSNPLMTKNFVAGAAINPGRIVKFDAVDGQVLQAAAAADLSIGISVPTIAAVAGERVDVTMSGIEEVKLGGVVTRGAKVTSDANGQAVAAVAGNHVVGFALASGVAGDMVDVHLAPGVF